MGGFDFQLPVWANVLIGLGGLELIKYMLSLRAHRRKDDAEAKKEEVSAGQQDAELREKELHVLIEIAEAAKAQVDEWKDAYATMRAEREDLRADKEQDRKIKAELRGKVAKFERQMAGVQEMLNKEIAARKAAESLYCDDETCILRHPPKGTYHSDLVPRNKKG